MADFISKYTGEEIESRLDKVSELETEKASLWDSEKQYAKGDFCIHKGYLWVCTTETGNTGTEPSTNYNVWNVTYSNPNLLDNPWFTVNQRGWTSGTPSGANVYTVDRWKINDTTTLVKDDNGITITVGDSIECLYQFLNMDLVKQIAGKDCTISAMLQTGEVFSIIITPPEDYNAYWDTPEFWVGNFVCDIYGSYNAYDKKRLRISNGNPGETISIRAVKLELGSVSTLANDSEPDYATELLKCQRYYQQMSLSDGRLMVSNAQGNIQFSAKINPPMRTTPTVSLLSSSIDAFDNALNVPYSTTSATILNCSANNHSIAYLNIQGFDLESNGHVLVGTLNNSIELSADL